MCSSTAVSPMTFLGGAILLSHSSCVIKGTFIPKLHSPATLSGALLLLLGCDSIPSDSKSPAWLYCRKQSSEILVCFDMITSQSYCTFGCTFVMQISPSTTSQRCSITSRSGDSGSHLSTGNSQTPAVQQNSLR